MEKVRGEQGKKKKGLTKEQQDAVIKLVEERNKENQIEKMREIWEKEKDLLLEKKDKLH
jgi:hypothetical protein